MGFCLRLADAAKGSFDQSGFRGKKCIFRLGIGLEGLRANQLQGSGVRFSVGERLRAAGRRFAIAT